MGSMAIPHLERSIKVDSSDPSVHYHLGIAYMQAGHIEKARNSLRQSLSMKRDFEGAADARKALAELGGEGHKEVAWPDSEPKDSPTGDFFEGSNSRRILSD